MFAMTIVFGASAQPWTLLYKSAEALQVAKANYEMSSPGSEMRLRDDYGQEAHLCKSSIHGVMFEDMSQSKLAHIERGLHQMRTQIEANQMGQADPAISAAMRAQRGSPGVITPFAPNGAFRQ